MKALNRYKLAVSLPVVLMITLAVMVSERGVRAAPPSGGSFIGTIKLDGVAPHQKSIDMSKEPSCAAVHKDRPITAEAVVVGPDGGLANVVVYISEGWGGSAAAPAAQTVTINQKGCQYLPHVVALNPGQPMKV